MSEKAPFVGIDVAKKRLDVAVHPSGETKTFPHDHKGMSALSVCMHSLAPALIVLEATGDYHKTVLSTLAAGGLPAMAVNPRQIRDFAKATGTLAKTDRIDALVIARFAEAVRPEVRPLRSEEAERLQALMTRRRQLIEMLTAEKNRLAMAPQWTRRDIRAHIQMLERQLKRIDDQLRDLIDQSPLWRQKDQILQSVRGWALSRPGPSWRSCLSWGPSIVARSPRWLAWPLSAVTAGGFGDDE